MSDTEMLRPVQGSHYGTKTTVLDGGQAFPRTLQRWNDSFDVSDGMTLRDWFAGHALAAYGSPFNEAETRKRVAARCYEMADAMIAARSLSKEGGEE